MTVYADSFNDEVMRILANGGIGVLRTDTLYGIVARVGDQAAVERVYAVKRRNPTKPPISLISSIHQLFDHHDEQTIELVNQFWPGANTIILPSTNGPEWLMRGTASVSYRLPDHPALRALIDSVGPIIAPSANPEGEEPAMSIDQATAYFGEAVDFYVDGGEVQDATPSKLYRLNGQEFERLR